MLDSLFNTELPLLVKVVVAFAIVLALLAAVMWLFKRFGGSRLGTTTPRGRQPRLAVIDAAAVDSRRRLVLIRRDNVEHLVMIGGPSDVLIEQNIVRAVPVAPPRGEAVPRAASAEPMYAPAEPPPPRAQRPEPPPRPPRTDLPPRRAPEAERPREAQAPRPMEPGRQPRLPPAAPAPTRVEPPRVAAVRPLAADVPAAAPASDTSLADMAHKLEAALRRAPEARRAEPPALTEPPPPMAPEVNGAGHGPRAPEIPPPARGDVPPDPKGTKTTGDGKSVFDSLEEEMANLLGTPPEKPEKK
jgi:hypothetical protein